MDQIEAFILAGGASRRMGTDKSQLLIQDQSFTQRLASQLFEITDSVTLVGHTANDSKLKTANDVYPGWGALGGLHAALDACTSLWAFVVACDLPFVTSELVLRLSSLRSNCDAVVPIQPDGRAQPLCSMYRKDVCLRRATELIETGLRRPLDVLNSVNTRWVRFDELQDLEDSRNFFVNINTPEDYYEATRKTVVAKQVTR